MAAYIYFILQIHFTASKDDPNSEVGEDEEDVHAELEPGVEQLDQPDLPPDPGQTILSAAVPEQDPISRHCGPMLFVSVGM